MAERLLDRGWQRHPDCYAATSPEPVEALRAIRLYPPESTDYFVEFLNLPELGQQEIKKWVPVQVAGGWYGLRTFRFQDLSAHGRLRSEQGLEYASAAMALPNLRSHPMVRPERVSQPIDGRKIRRSAKDLGRVLAMVQLSAREDVEAWLDPWLAGLKACFSSAWQELARSAGKGLRELLDREDVLEEALHTCEVGLLRGRGVTLENLAAIGEQVVVDLVEPLKAAAAIDLDADPRPAPTRALRSGVQAPTPSCSGASRERPTAPAPAVRRRRPMAAVRLASTRAGRQTGSRPARIHTTPQNPRTPQNAATTERCWSCDATCCRNTS